MPHFQWDGTGDNKLETKKKLIALAREINKKGFMD